MSVRVSRAPIAVTSEGDVVLNLTAMDVPATPGELAEALLRVRGTVFVGVRLSAKVARGLLHDLGMVLPNVTDPIAVRRLRRR